MKSKFEGKRFSESPCSSKEYLSRSVHLVHPNESLDCIDLIEFGDSKAETFKNFDKKKLAAVYGIKPLRALNLENYQPNCKRRLSLERISSRKIQGCYRDKENTKKVANKITKNKILKNAKN